MTVAGNAIAMTAVTSQTRMWQGSASLALETASAVVQATGTSGTQTGTAQVTVSF